MAPLPIDSVIPQLKTALQQRDEAVLVAPPGAGKTTRVPLALLNEPWLTTQKIIMLEPRRLAARSAAEWMASLLQEAVGETVGYRVRLDTKVSKTTRIEVVTEGILTRLLQDDPSLEGVGLLIFDEFHERSLDADLGLALSLHGRDLFREAPSLKLLLMSATLDVAKLAALLDDAPVVRSEGRLHPVSVQYSEPWQHGDDTEQRAAKTVLQALTEQSGSILVFLPGQREIQRTCKTLETALSQHPDVMLTPLYGDLSLKQQRQAIAPAPPGKRKVVLATAIAETSLTIDGVSVVIDSGLSRLPLFDPRTGMTRLHTTRLSKAASIQRMGRAGRLQPGTCYRLWSASQQEQLIPFTPAEMLQADLAPLALQLQSWGVNNPAELQWLDLPPAAPYAQALELLARLGALEPGPDANSNPSQWRLTAHGTAMAGLPTHPRLAHLLLVGRHYGLASLAGDLAALLSDRDPMPPAGNRHGDADIGQRLALLRGELTPDHRNRGLLQRLQQQSRQFQRLCRGRPPAPVDDPGHPHWTGFLLACAYPDRIARQRRQGSSDYRLSNGRAARLASPDLLQQSPWLAVAQLGGKKGDASDRIFLAADLDSTLFDGPLAAMVSETTEVTWDHQSNRLRAECQQRVGSLVISQQPLEPAPIEEKRQALVALVRKRGLSLLPWNDELRQRQARIMFLHRLGQEKDSLTANQWPDVSDQHLLETLEQWLAPYLDNISHIDHFARLDLSTILAALLPWPLPRELDHLAPRTFQVPSGSRIAIDYNETPPVLAVRLQEMFGCDATPRIANGAVTLKVHLLSPARRPLQVTQDLASFWQSSYEEVKKEMKGRYPKHHWPDDPLAAPPTAGHRRKPRT